MKKKTLWALGLGAAVGCASAIAAAPVESLSTDNESHLASAVKQSLAVSQAAGIQNIEKSIAVTKLVGNKLHAGLAEVAKQNSLLPRSLAAKDLAIDFPMMHFHSVKADTASVSLNLTAKRDASALSAVLSSLGATNISTYGRMVGARVPVSALDALNASPELLVARPAMARTHRGVFRSQGDYTLRTRFVKPASTGVTPGLAGGPTGLGVKIGVLSDSFACNPARVTNADGTVVFNQTAAQDLAGNEFAPVTVLKDISDIVPSPGSATCADGEDEGRAIIQLIADVAPDSTQAFYTAFDSEADFANGILALRNQFGADIVDDDVGYFDEPYFQDGIVAQAAQAVYDSGGMYFSSAGNSARLSYEAPFLATTATIAGISSTPGVYHNYNTAASPNTGNNFRLTRGSELTLALEWDQPYASATVGGAGSQSDLDIFLINAAGTVVAFSNDDNIGGDPVEILDYTNPGNAANFRVVVRVYAGPTPTRLKWVSIGGQTPATNGTSIGFNTNSPTATGHAAAAGAFSVGAAPYYNTTECGVAQTTMESFSSWGGTPILFDAAGNRLATPVIRQKPDATGPDGGRTSFFISAFDASAAQRSIVACQDPADGLANNFFGTSASAPHVAGVAALLKQAAPQATNAEIYAALRNTAADITVATANPGATVGFDFQSGYGFVRADAAYTALVDSIPNAFTFTAQNNVPKNSLRISNAVTVTGITAPAAISIAGGSYSVNGGAFVTSTGTVVRNDSVRVQQTASANPSTASTATLTIGGVSAGFTVTTEADDSIPDAFSFIDNANAPVSAKVTSNAVTISGINVPAAVTISKQASYSINGGPFLLTPSTINNGDTLQLRVSTSTSTAPVTATVTVGGVSTTWTVTVGTDTTADAFTYGTVSNLLPGATTTTGTRTITGINAPAPISVVEPGTLYSVNAGAFTSAPGTVSLNDTVRIQATASSSYGATTTASVNVGGTLGTLTLVTQAQDTTPDAFTFGTVSRTSVTTTSAAVYVAGINAPTPISISGDASAMYSVNGGAYTNAPGTVSKSQSVRVRLTAPANSSRDYVGTASVNIGGVIGTFTVTGP